MSASLASFNQEVVDLAAQLFEEHRFVDLAMFRQNFDSVLAVNSWELYEPFLATNLPYHFDIPYFDYDYRENPAFYRELISGLRLSGIFGYYQTDYTENGRHRYLASDETELMIFRLAISE
jgi:hypothetical protein